MKWTKDINKLSSQQNKYKCPVIDEKYAYN